MPRFVLAAVAAALLGSCAQAQPNAVFCAGGGMVKATRPQCARKAVGAMAKEGFLYACVTEDGHALGWDGTSTFLAMTFAHPTEGHSIVIIAGGGRDHLEGQRIGQALRARILEGATDPDAPEVYSLKEAAGRGTKAPSVRWVVESRDAVPTTVKHFAPVASLVLEKRGWNTASEPGKPYMLGTGQEHAAGLFMAPGPTALKLQFAYVVFNDDEESCGRVLDQIRSSLAKILFFE